MSVVPELFKLPADHLTEAYFLFHQTRLNLFQVHHQIIVPNCFQYIVKVLFVMISIMCSRL